MSATAVEPAERKRFRPSLGATVFTLAGLAVTIGLGTWQLERLYWKQELIARIARQMAEAPVPLPARIDDPTAWEFRPVTITGRFLNDKDMLLIARPHQGQVGYEALTPLQRADGAGVVLVNRGFVPMDRRDPATRAAARVEGEVSVKGIVRVPQPPGFFQPGNGNPAPGSAWMRADPPAMAAALSLSSVAPVVIEMLPGQGSGLAGAPAGTLAGIEPRVELPNNHLQYALTWYGLAVTLAGIYVLSQRKRADTGTDGRPDDRISGA
ncbi:surfeit locus 1 family protein [Azospirillum lipoferum]|uniref:SURF1-like protein n=1 Tax=Azospirillum lipoferum TaxID=193 RepID=A0A5A9FZ02_AZOLI|nr:MULTISPECIES: SURF1 family protein [Azospirillum]KAA0587563.1 SURF1 family protein [Azospirillum lipoferum]MCP1608881.1 surfeit locus 1 family protein [Azospirillum lipoferum]MDW5535804.1 SURF1 family protein [Azospirillum sp. NL1]